MKNTPLYYLLILLLAASCSKEVSIDTGTGTPGTGTPGTGTPGTGGGTTTAGSYQPSTRNSYWKYKQTGSFSSETTLTSKGEKRTVNGISCSVFTGVTTGTQPASPEALLGVKGNDYFSILQAASPNTGAVINVNFLYTNDALPEGGTWKHTAGTGNGFTALTPGKIVEKGITITVEGKTYKDVIHSQVELQYELPVLGTVSFATYDYYVAKNIGIIRVVSVGDPIYGGGIQTDMVLLEYSIK